MHVTPSLTIRRWTAAASAALVAAATVISASPASATVPQAPSVSTNVTTPGAFDLTTSYTFVNWQLCLSTDTATCASVAPTGSIPPAIFIAQSLLVPYPGLWVVRVLDTS